MSNSSASGGYIVPSQSNVPPGGVTLKQFIQTMVVGVSGFEDPTLVRPDWQEKPPKQPDISVDWIAYGIKASKVDGYAAIFPTPGQDSSTMNRQEKLEIQFSFYGPNSFDNAELFRDGLQLQQNNEALGTANMAFQEMSDLIIGPDLINERWVQRWMMTLTLVRQVVRTYPILSFVSAQGTVHTVVDGNNLDLNFDSNNRRSGA